jgi:hypothetical protein
VNALGEAGGAGVLDVERWVIAARRKTIIE